MYLLGFSVAAGGGGGRSSRDSSCTHLDLLVKDVPEKTTPSPAHTDMGAPGHGVVYSRGAKEGVRNTRRNQALFQGEVGGPHCCSPKAKALR